jgi:hypothetical protein
LPRVERRGPLSRPVRARCFALAEGGTPRGAICSRTPWRAKPCSSNDGAGFLTGGSIQLSSDAWVLEDFCSMPEVGLSSPPMKGVEVRDLRFRRAAGMLESCCGAVSLRVRQKASIYIYHAFKVELLRAACSGCARTTCGEVGGEVEGSRFRSKTVRGLGNSTLASGDPLPPSRDLGTAFAAQNYSRSGCNCTDRRFESFRVRKLKFKEFGCCGSWVLLRREGHG